jgi:hypothetical protein
MPLRDHWWCILVAKYGAFLFTEIGAFVITDYSSLRLQLYPHFFRILFNPFPHTDPGLKQSYSLPLP